MDDSCIHTAHFNNLPNWPKASWRYTDSSSPLCTSTTNSSCICQRKEEILFPHQEKKFIFSLSSCVKLVEAAWFFFALLEEAQKKGRAREKRALKNGLFFVMASFASRFCFSPKVSFLFYVSHWRVQVLFWRYGSIVRCHIQGQKIV